MKKYLFFLLFIGCSHYNPNIKTQNRFDMAEIEYPHRPPRNYELRHIARLKQTGDMEKLKSYIEELKARDKKNEKR